MGFNFKRGGQRIKVAPREQRTYNGELFASKAEMEYYRDVLIPMQSAGMIHLLERQVNFALGCPENVYRVDFMYFVKRPDPIGSEKIVVDVKGMTTQSFARHRKLWSIYGTCPLHIVKRSGKKFKTVEVIVPGVKLARKSKKGKAA